MDSQCESECAIWPLNKLLEPCSSSFLFFFVSGTILGSNGKIAGTDEGA